MVARQRRLLVVKMSEPQTSSVWSKGGYQGINAWVRSVAVRTGEEAPEYEESQFTQAAAWIWLAGAEQPDGLVDLRDW